MQRVFKLPEMIHCYDQDDADFVATSLAAGKVAAFSGRAPGKAAPSEDCAAVLPLDELRAVLIVADGLGGMPAGENASQLAIEQLAHELAAGVAAGSSLRTAILNGFEAANRAVMASGLGAATTLAVVEIDPPHIRPYHVGDSMILVVGQRGKIKHHAVSHSPVGYAVEAGFLDDEEAMYHDQRHLISNMVGSADMHITIGSALKTAPRDTLLVASDGLSDNLRLEEIAQRIRKGPLSRVAADLIRDSRDRMTNPAEGHPSKPDDLSFVVYRNQ